MPIISKAVRWFLVAGMALAFLGLIGSVLLQVFARLFLPSLPSWTEETSRIFLIWMVGFGGGLAYRERAYVNVDLLINLFPSWLKTAFVKVSDLLIAAFMILFTRQAWLQTIRMGLRQTSPALYIPMQYVFFALCLLGIGVFLFALASFAGGLFNKPKGEYA
ncbi:MAG: TRAP transporter small permease subunit [Planctomycetota bacterium]|jgi:TRAP-type C4-dicarboxylate transport system permease small subunit|nr:TRAP transporter small permease subunit [Planctomycetota bacterium]